MSVGFEIYEDAFLILPTIIISHVECDCGECGRIQISVDWLAFSLYLTF